MSLAEGGGPRAVGIDPGSRWFGLALSDPTLRFARPLETVDGEEQVLERLGALIAGEGVGTIVVGLPRNMDGSLGPKAQEALRFAGKLRARFNVPVETWDERLTTVQAERYLREAGVGGRDRKRRVNPLAAQILLQSYLDARAGGAVPVPPGAGPAPSGEGPPAPDSRPPGPVPGFQGGDERL